MAALLTIAEVNAMNEIEFQRIFGGVVELCPAAAARIATKRPFASAQQLCEAFKHYLDSLTEQEQVDVLRLHPELAGRVVGGAGELTAESRREQAAAGLAAATPDQCDLIRQYNARYKEKFGFPFIVCARENKVDAIITGLARRSEHTRAQEVAAAVTEVASICRLRVLDLVRSD